MEPEVGKWIIEFLARQPVDDRILNKLVSALPFSIDDFRLKKTLLIRSIQTEILSGTVSERLLNLLELVVELDFREGKVASESLKDAYCAVAVDCTVRFLDDDLRDDCKYFVTLKRIWRVRVLAMEKSENSGLVSEKLLKWKDDLEAAVCDVELRGKILLMNTRNEALGKVEGYLKEAWNDLGLSYIEKSAQDLINSRNNGEGVEDVELASSEPDSVGDGDHPMPTELLDVSGDGTSENRVSEVVGNTFVANDGIISGGRSAVDGENCKEKARVGNGSSVEVPQRDKNLSETQGNIGDNPAGNQGGNIVTLGGKHSPLGTSFGVSSESGKGVQVRYKLSALRSRVKGHRRISPAKIADLEEMDEHIPKSTGVEAQDVNAAVESLSAQPVNAPTNNADGIGKNDSPGQQSAGRDDVNPSAAAANRRLEMGEASPGSSVKKTKRRFWTPLEEDALRTGVKKFGRGSWKLILYAHSDVFQGRTEVDLKDKWRNMVK